MAYGHKQCYILRYINNKNNLEAMKSKNKDKNSKRTVYLLLVVLEKDHNQLYGGTETQNNNKVFETKMRSKNKNK